MISLSLSLSLCLSFSLSLSLSLSLSPIMGEEKWVPIVSYRFPPNLIHSPSIVSFDNQKIRNSSWRKPGHEIALISLNFQLLWN